MWNTLLLTSAIDVNIEIPWHKRKDINIRVKDYIKALTFYITHSDFTEIVFCDGSNYCLKDFDFIFSLAQIFEKKLELLSFQQDIQKVIKKWKWFWEQQIINYALQHSEILKNSHSFYKITGRYLIKNINNILKNETEEENVFFRTSLLDRQNCNTAFFKTSPIFFKKNLQNVEDLVNDFNGHWLEFCYYQRLCWKRLSSFTELPIFMGISGSWGNLYPWKILIYIKQICNKLWLHTLK